MKKFGSHWNFGYSRNLRDAVHYALLDRFQGHDGTRRAYEKRFQHTILWLKEKNIKYAEDITQEILTYYSEYVRDMVENDEIEISYAQNLLSTANKVLQCLCGKKSIHVSPASVVGKRRNIRTVAPDSYENEALVSEATAILRSSRYREEALMIEMAFAFGLRSQESALFDAVDGLRCAKNSSLITISRGTKGNRGKYIDRPVPVPSSAMAILEEAAELQGNRSNLIPFHYDGLHVFLNHLRHVALPILRQVGLSTIHDLRAGFACRRYKEISGSPAPCVIGYRLAEKKMDLMARLIVSNELGHSRIQAAGPYIGSRK